MTNEGNRSNDDLRRIVRHYIREWRPAAEAEREYYRSKSFDDAIVLAGRAIVENHKHPHQYRLSKSTLEQATQALAARKSRLRSCKSFADLFTTVEELVGVIPGIGELYVYDTAQRLGANLGRQPTQVYLHRGARDGALNIGMDPNKSTLEISDLPGAFKLLSAEEAEDCLCIYKDHLKQWSSGVPISDLSLGNSCGRGRRHHRRC